MLILKMGLPKPLLLRSRFAQGEGLAMSVVIDLGHKHTLRFASWKPDRALNPQYDGIPDIERYSAIVEHMRPSGKECCGCITLDSPEARQLHEFTNAYLASKGLPTSPYVAWTVESWEPLTLSPSLLCKMPILDAEGKPTGEYCNDHGFIRNSVWVPC